MAKLYLAHCELNGCTGHDAGRVQLGEAKARLQSDEAMVEGMWLFSHG